MDLRDQLQSALGTTYTLDRELGGGGMARVFAARDVSLDRSVVVKVLPPETSGAVSVERFQREISIAAKLQHPHIVPVLSAGAVDGVPYYTMPYIEGESLRGRLTREGELPIADVVGILKEVARALAYAHERGVVHRDIKPDNVLFSGGSVMVTDFGVAKALSASTSGGGTSLTQLGVALGTPAYMAPEQASAEPTVDHRADLYAFGCLAYELLAGATPFAGRPGPAQLAAQVTETPEPVTKRRPSTPPVLAALVMQCLEKRPADRPQSATGVLRALENVVVTPSAMASVALPAVNPAARRFSPRARVITGGLALLVVGAFVGAAIARAREPDVPRDNVVVRAPLTFGERLRLSPQEHGLAISPDGQTIAFIGITGSGREILLRRLDDTRLITLAEGGLSQVFFAPDGRALVARAQRLLQRIELQGGSQRTIATLGPTDILYGAAWTPKDSVVLALQSSGIATAGASTTNGPLRVLFRPDTLRGERTLRWPLLLPDGQTIVYGQFDQGGRADAARLVAASLVTGKRWPLDLGGGCALGVVDDALVYSNGSDALMAVPFDARRVRVVGKPVAVLDSVPVPLIGCPQVSISRAGDLFYQTRPGRYEVAEVDEHGNSRRYIDLALQTGRVRYSPDGRRVALQMGSQTGGGLSIWIYDVAAHALSPLETDGSYNSYPEWTPDGKRVVFASNRGGVNRIWWEPWDKSSAAESLVVFTGEMSGSDVLNGVTPDGAYLLYAKSGKLAMHRLVGPPRSDAVLDIPSRGARLSPDGKWVAYVAYTSDTKNRFEVYVQPFPGPGPRVQVSEPGARGLEPVWSRDGHRLYYTADSTAMMAEVRLSPNFAVLTRRALYDDRPYQLSPGAAGYDVTPDGKHLLKLRGVSDAEAVVVHNWRAQVRRRMAEGK